MKYLNRFRKLLKRVNPNNTNIRISQGKGKENIPNKTRLNHSLVYLTKKKNGVGFNSILDIRLGRLSGSVNVIP